MNPDSLLAGFSHHPSSLFPENINGGYHAKCYLSGRFIKLALFTLILKRYECNLHC
jgi:hypothetical protein